MENTLGEEWAVGEDEAKELKELLIPQCGFHPSLQLDVFDFGGVLSKEPRSLSGPLWVPILRKGDQCRFEGKLSQGQCFLSYVPQLRGSHPEADSGARTL